MTIEPVRLSRELATAAADCRDWELGLRADAQGSEPLLSLHRENLSRTRFSEISELDERDPMREPLLRWVHALLERRVDGAWLAREAHARYAAVHGSSLSGSVKQSKGKKGATLSELGVACLDSEHGAAAWAALERHGRELCEITTMLWQRRVLVAQELGLPSADQFEVPCEQLQTLAEEWLTTCAPLLEEFRDARAWAWAQRGLGRALNERFPGRLTPGSLSDWFRDTRLFEALPLRSFPLPAALAPASFARALDLLGQELRFALAPQNQPFVIAHDPHRLEDHALGACLSGLLGNPEFLRLRLGVGRADQRDALRAMAQCALLESARRAVRVLLRPLAQAGAREVRRAYPEIVFQHLGPEVPEHLAGVWLRLACDDGQRFVALALAASRSAELVEDHDEDWFRNPRAIDQLRAEGEQPPRLRAEVETLRVGFEHLRGALASRL